MAPKSDEIMIDGRPIGPGHPPYIIAEMSANHLGSLDRAFATIRAAKRAGADTVKIQTYDAEALTIDCGRPEFRLQNPLWQGRTYYELYRDSALSVEHTRAVFQYARETGMTLFSTPFDEKAVNLLMDLSCPAFKIASFEAVDPRLLKCVARTGKPVILSTGISTLDEIGRAVKVLEQGRAAGILLLHCISAYPASIRDCHLNALHTLKRFSPCVGLSDHTPDDTAALASIAMGGCAVEKHFTLSRADGGPDAAFSIEEDQMRRLADTCRKVWDSLGSADIFSAGDRPGREHARSLYVVRDVGKGDRVTDRNVRSIRPGWGLSPFSFDRVMGKRFNRDLCAGTALKWEYLS